MDELFAWKAEGLEPIAIHKKLGAARRRGRLSAPDLTNVRRALRGKTFKRGRSETRGRKKVLSSRNLESMDAAREQLIEKADGEGEVHWAHVLAKSRVPRVHRSTALKNMTDAGYDVKWRPARGKPMRGEADEAERKRVCNKLRKLPVSYWQRRVLLYTDNKHWDAPTTAKARSS